jgi:uncharacterized protein
MNLQEREQLSVFLQQLTQAQASQKDAEADALIKEACARQSDAGYLLVQRAMQLELALQATQAQARQLQADLEQARTGGRTSFLADANSWGRAAPPAPEAPAAAAQGPVMQPRGPAAAPAAAAAPAWGSGFLGNVATTAAGVVAGSFLFQGIQNLMGHHNQGGAWGANASSPPVAANLLDNDKSEPGSDEVDDATDIADAADDFDAPDDSA